MKTTVISSRLAPGVLGIAVLATAGCTTNTNAPQEPATVTVTATESSVPEETPTSDAAPVTSGATGFSGRSADNKTIPVEALETLWVPSLCGNDAAALVHGALPASAIKNPGPTPGLVRNSDGTPQGAYTDLNGDGRDEAAVAFYCDMGGVSWPAHLLIYDNDLRFITAVGPEDWDLGAYSQGRGPFRFLHWDENSAQIGMLAGTANDAACCPSRDITVQLTLDGSRPVTTIIADSPRA